MEEGAQRQTPGLRYAARRATSDAHRPGAGLDTPADESRARIDRRWLDRFGRSSPLAMFAAGLVWIGGSVAMWLALFELPALADIPVNWRLAAGVIGNLLLIWIARAVAARLRPRPSAPMTGGNPFPDS